MVVTKDRPHGPGHSIPMFIVVECEDHLAIQAPFGKNTFYFFQKALIWLTFLYSLQMTVLPFTNTVDLIVLRGQTLIDAFEFSASKLNPDGTGSAGAFLQVSGQSSLQKIV